MQDLLAFGWRVLPGILLITITYVLLPRKTDAVKIFLLVFAFLLVRDAMTPAGFWQFGVTPETIWLRFIENGTLLVILGCVSVVSVLFLLLVNQGMRRYLLWIGDKPALAIVAGVLGAVVVAVPFLLTYGFVPLEERGGPVQESLWLPLIFFALGGNLLEEVLFRGYLQGYLAERTGPWRAAVLSGFVFAVGHIFLSATVTDLGVLVLVFTLYEGIVCGLVRVKHGVAASTLTHGLAIFTLSAGLL